MNIISLIHRKIQMKYIRTILVMVALLLGVILVVLFTPKGEHHVCVSPQPMLKGEAGYELVDLVKKDVWGTPDFTAEEYATFSFPMHWLFWVKNDPRTLLADSGEFLRSPGCSEPGQFTYMRAFEKNFLHVVQLHKVNARPPDGQKLIRRIELEKYHVLTYGAGRTVSILRNAAGERFIGVARTSPPPSEPPTLPEGWTLTTHILNADVQVNLLGHVSVLRMDNEDSYQGPLPADLSF
jgi:hypothetical protein